MPVGLNVHESLALAVEVDSKVEIEAIFRRLASGLGPIFFEYIRFWMAGLTRDKS